MPGPMQATAFLQLEQFGEAESAALEGLRIDSSHAELQAALRTVREALALDERTDTDSPAPGSEAGPATPHVSLKRTRSSR